MLVAGLALAGLATAPVSRLAWSQPKTDWETQEDQRNWKEVDAAIPAYPKPENLIEFQVSALAAFRFFIDGASLSVGEDGVVRYTLVARSPNGVDNVSFEGIRCEAGLYRIYATGRSNRTWSPRHQSEWREIEPKTIQRWHQALRREYFCPQNAIIGDAAEGVDALRRGGHPRKASTGR